MAFGANVLVRFGDARLATGDALELVQPDEGFVGIAQAVELTVDGVSDLAVHQAWVPGHAVEPALERRQTDQVGFACQAPGHRVIHCREQGPVDEQEWIHGRSMTIGGLIGW